MSKELQAEIYRCVQNGDENTLCHIIDQFHYQHVPSGQADYLSMSDWPCHFVLCEISEALVQYDNAELFERLVLDFCHTNIANLPTHDGRLIGNYAQDQNAQKIYAVVEHRGGDFLPVAPLSKDENILLMGFLDAARDGNGSEYMSDLTAKAYKRELSWGSYEKVVSAFVARAIASGDKDSCTTLLTAYRECFTDDMLKVNFGHLKDYAVAYEEYEIAAILAGPDREPEAHHNSAVIVDGDGVYFSDDHALTHEPS